MKSAALSMAALCVCPPAILATSVATVPAVKRAVHHATAPKHKLAQAKKPLRTAAAKTLPCDATPAIRMSSVLPYAITPIDTSDAGTGDLPGSPLMSGGVVPVGGTPILAGFGDPGTPGGGGGGGGTTPGSPSAETPGTPGTETPGEPAAAVPEPGTWLMLISGFGLVGIGLRWRRKRLALADAGTTTVTQAAFGGRAKKATRLSSLVAGLGFGDAAAGGASVASVAAKAMMCVCPTAAIVGTTMAVPPVRNAVYKATAVPTPAPKYMTTVVKPPCDPTIRSAETAAPMRIVDASDASPRFATALLASTSTGGQ